MSEHAPKHNPLFGDDELFERAVDHIMDTTGISYGEARTRVVSNSSAPVEESANEVTQETAPKKPSIAERLVAIESEFGFIPRSILELRDVNSLVGGASPDGVVGHLGLVLRHQKKYADNPDRAVHAIVTRYADYARASRVEGSFLREMEAHIKNDDGTLEPSRLGSSWHYDGSLARPLFHTLWTLDAGDYMRGDEEVNPFGAIEATRRYSAHNKPAVKAVAALFEDPVASGFTDAFYQSMRHEKHRFEFWSNALQDARRFEVARPIAFRALVNLGLIKDESF